MLDAALDYAAHGWRVFPCRRKVPLTEHGVHDATTDAEQIRAWWTQWPDANIGIACGGGLVVLDVDPRHGGDASLRELEHEHGEIITLTARTGGGGLHLYLRGELPQRVGFRRGLDLKASGGYVVAPPSRHESGRRYAWIAPGDLPQTPEPVPAWLARIIDPPRPALHRPPRIVPASDTARYVEAAIERECMDVALTAPGARNARLYSAAWSLSRFLVDGRAHEAPLRAALTIAARHAGLTDHEIERTIDSALARRAA